MTTSETAPAAETVEQPVEGYHAALGMFVKVFSVGSPMAGLGLDQLAEHPATTGMARAAAREAAGAGYPPLGAGRLIHAEADGETKTRLSYAVPVAPLAAAVRAARIADDD